MIRTTNVRHGFIDTENVRYVTEQTYRRWTRRLVPRRGDVVLTREAPLGGVGMLRTDDSIFLGQRLYHFRADPQKLDAHFLMYSLMAPDLQSQILGFGSGATVEHMRLGDIPRLEISLPPLSTQRQVGAMLAAYDELIENNARRIRILEETAQAIYREWFVRFRFPGHERVKLVDSSVGALPQGWEVKRVKDILKRLTAGQVYTERTVATSGRVPVLDQSRDEVLGYHNNEPDHEATPDSPVIAFGDHTCKMQLMVQPFSVGPNVVPFVSQNRIPISYLYFIVSNLVETREYKRHWTELSAKHIVLAPNYWAERFAKVATPMFEQMDALMRKNLNLRRTRDLLLPGLLSGEIAV